MTTLGSVLVPIRTHSTNEKQRVHWRALRKSSKSERQAVALMLAAELDVEKVRAELGAGGVVVLLERHSPGMLDADDNLRGALKAVKDEVAAWLGVDDGVKETRVEWRYAQEKSTDHAVRITLGTRPWPECPPVADALFKVMKARGREIDDEMRSEAREPSPLASLASKKKPTKPIVVDVTVPKPSTVLGRPFAKGQSGNPGGRPALPDVFRDRGPDMLQKMLAIADNPKHPYNFEALRWCSERIYGKPRQDVDLKHDTLTPGAAALLALVEARRVRLAEEAAKTIEGTRG